MHPILFAVSGEGGQLVFGSYGALVALAVVLTGGLVVGASARAGMDVPLTFSALAMVVGGGFAGSWLTFGLVELARTGTLEAVRSGGGLVFFGAVPGGLIGAWVSGRTLGLDWVRLLDLSVPALAAGHALGRMGCFFGGCCFGGPSEGPLAVVYTDPIAAAAGAGPLARHPTPLYEAAGLLAIGLAFALVPARQPGSGRRALGYLAAYAILRLLTESSRGDEIRGLVHGVSTSSMIALCALLAAAAIAARRGLFAR